MIVDPRVREQQVEEPGALGELDCVLALVRQQGAHAYAKVLKEETRMSAPSLLLRPLQCPKSFLAHFRLFLGIDSRFS